MRSDVAHWKRYFRSRLKENDGYLWVTSNPDKYPMAAENAAAKTTLLFYITEVVHLDKMRAAAKFAIESGHRPHSRDDIQAALTHIETRMEVSRSEWHSGVGVKSVPGESALGVGNGASIISALLFLTALSHAQREGLLLAYPEKSVLSEAFFASPNQVRFGEATWMLRHLCNEWIVALAD